MKRISLLFLFICCLFMTGCASNKEKSIKGLYDFQLACNNYGFSVDDNLNGYADVTYIAGASIAKLDDITIEMVVYDSTANATKAHDSHIDVFKAMKGSGAVIESEEGKNYHKYSMISNGYYMISERVGNTLVFSKTLVENKEKVEDVLGDIGY